MFGRYKHSGRAELPCPVAKCFKTPGTYYVTITHFPSMCESLAKVGRHGWTLDLLWRHRVDTGMSVCQHHPQRTSRDEDSEEEPHGQSLSITLDAGLLESARITIQCTSQKRGFSPQENLPAEKPRQQASQIPRAAPTDGKSEAQRGSGAYNGHTAHGQNRSMPH